MALNSAGSFTSRDWEEAIGARVELLRDTFAKLTGDKEFMAELRKVGGDDADLLMGKETEPVLRQVLTVTPGGREFVKTITKKHPQR